MLVQMKQIEINHFQFVGFKLLTFFRYICYEIKYLERARIILRRRQVAIAHEIENSVQLVLRHKHSRTSWKQLRELHSSNLMRGDYGLINIEYELYGIQCRAMR